jgi:hypothetical protein
MAVHRAWLLLELKYSASALPSGSNDSSGGRLLDIDTVRHIIIGCIRAIQSRDILLDAAFLDCVLIRYLQVLAIAAAFSANSMTSRKGIKPL